MRASVEALQWLVDKEGWAVAIIANDSKSSLEGIKNYKFETKNCLLRRAYELLGRLEQVVCLVWIPSHCEVVGNEFADEVAGRVAKEDQKGKGWLFEVAKARIRSVTQKRRRAENERVARIYQNEREVSDPRGLKSYRRFRVGHSMELKEYRKRIGLQEDGLCRLCGEEEENTEHVLLKCGSTLYLRRMLEVSEMGDLVDKPDKCWRIWNWFRGHNLA